MTVCRQCVAVLPAEARYCRRCGAEGVDVGAASNDTLLFELRPRFLGLGGVFDGKFLGLWAFLTVWCGGFFGGFGMAGVELLNRTTHLHLPVWSTFVIFGSAAFVLVPAGCYLWQRHTSARRVWRFFPDRLVYGDRDPVTPASGPDGFDLRQTVFYSTVEEMQITRTLSQARRGLGTLILSTPGHRLSDDKMGSGIRLRDLPRVQVLHELIRRRAGLTGGRASDSGDPFSDPAKVKHFETEFARKCGDGRR